MKSKTFWIGRRAYKDTAYPYEASSSDNLWHKKNGFHNDKYSYVFCDDIFEAITGVNLKKGEIAEYKLVRIKRKRK